MTLKLALLLFLVVILALTQAAPHGVENFDHHKHLRDDFGHWPYDFDDDDDDFDDDDDQHEGYGFGDDADEFEEFEHRRFGREFNDHGHRDEFNEPKKHETFGHLDGKHEEPEIQKHKGNSSEHDIESNELFSVNHLERGILETEVPRDQATPPEKVAPQEEHFSSKKLSPQGQPNVTEFLSGQFSLQEKVSPQEELASPVEISTGQFSTKQSKVPPQEEAVSPVEISTGQFATRQFSAPEEFPLQDQSSSPVEIATGQFSTRQFTAPGKVSPLSPATENSSGQFSVPEKVLPQQQNSAPEQVVPQGQFPYPGQMVSQGSFVPPGNVMQIAFPRNCSCSNATTLVYVNVMTYLS